MNPVKTFKDFNKVKAVCFILRLGCGIKSEPLCSGHLRKAKTKKTVGILDLGGGSTQITFLPRLKVQMVTVFKLKLLVVFD